jgi:hypothetical protein
VWATSTGNAYAKRLYLQVAMPYGNFPYVPYVIFPAFMFS